MKFKSIILLGSLCLAMVACEADGVNFLSSPHYASTVISFLPGEGSGYGKSYLPAIVLGAPVGGSKMAGSVDVLSLGVGGEIELAFDGVEIVDGPGPDFIVFENPFWPGSNSTQVWAELGEVAVYTNDGEWHTYECDVDDIGSSWPGCAGWTPTLSYDPDMMDILDPIKTGETYLIWLIWVWSVLQGYV